MPLSALGAVKKGQAFPDLSEFAIEGTVPPFKGKIAFIDIWASWCGPCKKAMPIFAELHETYKEKGLVIIGVSVDEDKADMDAYLKRSPVPFAIVRDPKSKLARKLGVGGIPTTYVVAPNGKIRAIHEGFGGESSRKKYIADIEALLGDVVS